MLFNFLIKIFSSEIELHRIKKIPLIKIIYNNDEIIS